MKFLHLTTVTAAACLLLLQACKEDTYIYPSVVTEFADAETDHDGTLIRLITDKGEIFDIQSRERSDDLRNDTTYRTVSIFQPFDDGKASVYSIQLVVSPLPEKESYFKTGIKTDPTGIRSIWQSGNYLNMILTPMIKEQSHAFHFIDYGIEKKEGKNILHLGLYHDNRNDESAFTHEVYLSVPLWKYKDTLHPGDSIFFRINTYKEGETIRKFIFPEIITY